MEKVDSIISKYIKWYKENIKKFHIIIFALAMFLFFVFLVSKINEFSSHEITRYNVAYIQAIKDNAILSFLIIFAGITPYFFLSILGLLSVYNLAINVALLYVINRNFLLLIGYIIISIVIMICYSLLIATGIYYCSLSTKRFKYSQSKGFSLNDVKLSIYKLRNKEEKIKEYEENKKKKNEKMEKLNVKVPYINFIITFAIVNIIMLITSIFIR